MEQLQLKTPAEGEKGALTVRQSRHQLASINLTAGNLASSKFMHSSVRS